MLLESQGNGSQLAERLLVNPANFSRNRPPFWISCFLPGVLGGVPDQIDGWRHVNFRRERLGTRLATNQSAHENSGSYCKMINWYRWYWLISIVNDYRFYWFNMPGNERVLTNWLQDETSEKCFVRSDEFNSSARCVVSQKFLCWISLGSRKRNSLSGNSH